jgi:periplasmic protein TonB
MNKLSLSFSCSFLLHGLLILSALSMGSFLPTLDQPVVMDFTLVQGDTTYPSLNKTEQVSQPKQISVSSSPVGPVLEKSVELPPQEIVEPLPTPVVAVTVPEKSVELPQKETVTPSKAPVVTTMAVSKPVVERQIQAKEEEIKTEPAPRFIADQEAQPVQKVTASLSIEGHGEDTVATGRKVYLKQHFQYIKETIQKKIYYPGVARKMGWEGKVVVSFVVKENGDIQDIKVVESSGYQALDKNAMTTIKKAAPFPSPPVTAEVVIPVTYQLG